MKLNLCKHFSTPDSNSILSYYFAHWKSCKSGIGALRHYDNILLASATIVVIPLFFTTEFRGVCHCTPYAHVSFTVLADATIVVVPLCTLTPNIVWKELLL